MGVIDTLEAVGNAARPFLESGYCDILISSLYLYLAWYAVHMSQCRVWPWAHRLRAVFFLCTSKPWSSHLTYSAIRVLLPAILLC